MAEEKELDFVQLEAAASQGEGEGAAASGGVDGSIDAPKRSAQTSRGDNAIVEMFKASSHPKIAVFHVLFKVASVVLFFLGTLLGLGYISWFVPCVILLCVDFWVVKNITGRIMVGLRWWSDIDEEGESVWRFESIDDPSLISNTDYRIFWYSQYLNTILWLMIALLNIFYIDRLLLIAVALTLSVSNIIGYWKCSRDAKQRLESGVQSFVATSAMSYFTSNGFSLLSSSDRGNASGSTASTDRGTI